MRRHSRPALLLVLALLALGACNAVREPDQLAGGAASGIDTCTRCHGDASQGNAAPPRSVLGATSTAEAGVGAHQAHLQDGHYRQAISCSECHVVPSRVDDPGHMGNGRAPLTFGALATANGATPSWNTAQLNCSSTYCHGSTLPGGSNTSPQWTKVDGSQASCGTCHAIPPPPASGHPVVTGGVTACSACHPATVKADGTIDVAGGKHIDGSIQVAGGACTSCHGDSTRTAAIAPAPPKDTQGNTATSARGVGAHQAHLTDGALRQAMACSDCHAVPSSTAHSNGTVDLAFSSLARTGGLSPAFDSASMSCATTYCHGATLPGGSNTAPTWNKVDGTQAACGTCHAIPPPASSGHPIVSGGTAACAACHPGTVKADGTIDTAGGKHVNGVLDVSGGMSCTSCHGDPTRAAAIAPAPPSDTSGNTATTARGVGAHQAHLVDGPLRRALACSECHTVPSSSAHSNGAVDLSFGALARTGGLSPAFNPSSLSCASTYCHGSTLPGGSNKAPQWTRVDGTQAACGTCHGVPPPAPHTTSTSCGSCHGGYTSGSVNLATHINGSLDVSGMTCTSCHGDGSRTLVAGADASARAAPPADTSGNTATSARGVGAHQAHLNKAAGAISRPTACSECHLVPSSTAHSNGAVAVTFGAKARADGANPTWNGAGCSASYCHGATLAGGSNKNPVWTGGPSQAACGTCHGTPPSSGEHGEHSGRSCGDCHGGTYTRTSADPSLHVNGVLDVGNRVTSWNPSTGSCVGCHGSDSW